MYVGSITKDEINQLTLKSFDKEIIVIKDQEKLKEILPYLYKQKVLGFDTESKPSFKKGERNKIALLQLATEDFGFIFKLQKLGLPKNLLRLLSNDTVLKIGVAVHDDIKELQTVKNFKPACFIDLQKEVEEFGITDKSLKKLTAIILGFRISKSQRLSNWEEEKLSEAQLKYAVTDAWVCFEIYKKLLTSTIN